MAVAERVGRPWVCCGVSVFDCSWAKTVGRLAVLLAAEGSGSRLGRGEGRVMVGLLSGRWEFVCRHGGGLVGLQGLFEVMLVCLLMDRVEVCVPVVVGVSQALET